MPSSFDVHGLPPYDDEGGERRTGPFVGFAFNKDGVRCQTEYGSLDEKLHCESAASSATGGSGGGEAREKLGEWIERTGRVRERLYRRVHVGFAKSPAGATKEDFDTAVRAIEMELSRDSGSNYDEILEALEDLIEHRFLQIVQTKKWSDDLSDDEEEEDSGECADYDNTPTMALLQAADLWFLYPRMLEEHVFCYAYDYGESAYDALHCILDALVKQKEIQMALRLAERAYNEIKPDPNAGYSGIYLRYQAECAEALGEMEKAHGCYKMMEVAREPYYDEEEEDESSITELDNSPKGSLSERIERTRSAKLGMGKKSYLHSKI